MKIKMFFGALLALAIISLYSPATQALEPHMSPFPEAAIMPVDMACPDGTPNKEQCIADYLEENRGYIENGPITTSGSTPPDLCAGKNPFTDVYGNVYECVRGNYEKTYTTTTETTKPTIPTTSGSGNYIAPGYTLRPGLKNNNEVKNLQSALNQKLGLSLTVDGSYGPATIDAVKKLQEMKGLTADGLAGKNTQAQLAGSGTTVIKNEPTNFNNFESCAGSEPYYNKENGTWSECIGGVYRQVDKPSTVTEECLDTEQCLPSNYTDKRSNLKSTTLYRGMKDNRVKTLQQKLNEKLSLDLTVDGSFGPATEIAVKTFQVMNGLTEDGLAGLGTQAKLGF